MEFRDFLQEAKTYYVIHKPDSIIYSGTDAKKVAGVRDKYNKEKHGKDYFNMPEKDLEYYVTSVPPNKKEK